MEALATDNYSTLFTMKRLFILFLALTAFTSNTFSQSNDEWTSILESLKSTDQEVRRDGLRDISIESHGEKATVLLVKLLEDEDPVMRMIAAGSLGRPGLAAGVSPLIKTLKDPNANVRAAAVYSLGVVNIDSSVNEIAKLLRDDSDEVSERAAYALAKFKSTKALRPLQNMLESEDQNHKILAMQSLAHSSFSKSADLIAKHVSSQSEVIRAEAVLALAQLGDPRAKPYLKALAYHEDEGIRGRAIGNLRIYGRSIAIDILMDVIEHDINKNVRYWATQSLWEYGSDVYNAGMLLAIERSPHQVRLVLLENAVALSGRPTDVGILMDFMNSKHATYKERKKVSSLLRDITGLNYGPDPRLWNKWWKKNRSRYMEQY